MHRIGREQLVTMMAVALKTAPQHVKQQLRSKLPHEADAAADVLARRMARLIDNDGYIVIGAELVPTKPCGEVRGRFGIDEPDPTRPQIKIIPALDAAQGCECQG
jgi:hypothetical protein